MKTFLAMLAVAGTVTAMTAMSATDAAAWGCFARGTTGATGWSWAYNSRGAAVRRALSECAVRTPRGEMCRITNCSRYANESGYWGR